MTEPTCRIKFDDQTEEIGLYLDDDGGVELVWYDQQDSHWPVKIPAELVKPLAALLGTGLPREVVDFIGAYLYEL